MSTQQHNVAGNVNGGLTSGSIMLGKKYVNEPTTLELKALCDKYKRAYIEATEGDGQSAVLYDLQKEMAARHPPHGLHFVKEKGGRWIRLSASECRRRVRQRMRFLLKKEQANATVMAQPELPPARAVGIIEETAATNDFRNRHREIIIKALSDQHAKSVNDLRNQQSIQLNAVKHATENLHTKIIIKVLSDQHTKTLNDLKVQHVRQLKVVLDASQDRQTNLVKALSDGHTKSLNELKEAHSKELEAARDRHTKIVNDLKHEHSRHLKAAEDRYLKMLEEAKSKQQEDPEEESINRLPPAKRRRKTKCRKPVREDQRDSVQQKDTPTSRPQQSSIDNSTKSEASDAGRPAPDTITGGGQPGPAPDSIISRDCSLQP